MNSQAESKEIKLVRKYAAESRDMGRIINWWKRTTCGNVTSDNGMVTFSHPTMKYGWVSVTLAAW